MDAEAPSSPLSSPPESEVGVILGSPLPSPGRELPDPSGCPSKQSGTNLLPGSPSIPARNLGKGHANEPTPHPTEKQARQGAASVAGGSGARSTPTSPALPGVDDPQCRRTAGSLPSTAPDDSTRIPEGLNPSGQPATDTNGQSRAVRSRSQPTPDASGLPEQTGEMLPAPVADVAESHPRAAPTASPGSDGSAGQQQAEQARRPKARASSGRPRTAPKAGASSKGPGMQVISDSSQPAAQKRKADAGHGNPAKKTRPAPAPRKSAKDKRWEAPFVYTDERSPLANADLRAILLHPAAWDILTPEEKQDVLAKFPDGTPLLDAGTPAARPDTTSLRNDDNFRHDCARYCEGIQLGQHDEEWLAQAWTAHEKHRLGHYDGFLREQFEEEWSIKLPAPAPPEGSGEPSGSGTMESPPGPPRPAGHDALSPSATHEAAASGEQALPMTVADVKEDDGKTAAAANGEPAPDLPAPRTTGFPPPAEGVSASPG
ncbi:hypothetical protein VTJ83DRAFT_5905 [Remersonia thermophila]|uniref:DEUBAD domain-containing protein n=1 Tax=Remersonia thermophila TaxID=72144 RepID=A0ABR4D884_9PEZI